MQKDLKRAIQDVGRGVSTHPGLVFLLEVKEAFGDIILEVRNPLLFPGVGPERDLL